ncbi:MAG: PQQ-dependent sugar dehydrogenase [Patescibacteria group bacterium]
MIKKIIIGLLSLAAIGVFVFAAVFYYQNLQGNSAPESNTISSAAAVATITTSDPPNNLGLSLPAGMSVKVFAEKLNNPRVLKLDPKGNLVVSEFAGGRITVLIDKNGDGKVDSQKVILKNLNQPHGFEFYCLKGKCKLYVAENDAVSVYDYNSSTLTASNRKKIIDLPAGGVHVTRTLLIKDNKLYIAIGSSCNVCHESDNHRAKVLVSNLDGSGLKDFATGLRNSVFMVTNPQTGEIWATENGRDLLGDNIPPDEINILKQGKNYGWPICYGKNIHDTEFDKNTYIRNPCMEPFETPSYINIQAHSAPLGLAFVPKDGWPQAWQGSLFVAFHGSWNRTVPTGYKIVRFDFKSNGTAVQTDFITGWLKGGTAWGRPVDILTLPGGIMYVSDDTSNVVYRFTYKML